MAGHQHMQPYHSLAGNIPFYSLRDPALPDASLSGIAAVEASACIFGNTASTGWHMHMGGCICGRRFCVQPPYGDAERGHRLTEKALKRASKRVPNRLTTAWRNRMAANTCLRQVVLGSKYHQAPMTQMWHSA